MPRVLVDTRAPICVTCRVLQASPSVGMLRRILEARNDIKDRILQPNSDIELAVTSSTAVGNFREMGATRQTTLESPPRAADLSP